MKPNKWETKFKKKRLVVLNATHKDVAEHFGCTAMTVGCALNFKTNTTKAIEIREYVLKNYNVYYSFSEGMKRKEFPAIPLCQDCKNHIITEKGDYCSVKDQYIRKRQKSCFYKIDCDALPVENCKKFRKKLSILEYPKFFEQLINGTQTEIYRPRTPFWSKKLFAQSYIVYDKVEIRCFKKYNEILTFKVADIVVDYGKPEWGCNDKEPVYVIKIGKRIEQ